jgi:U4/U6.U5 tri-snRNP component SNU23
MDNLPEATESLKQRTDDLGLEKNLNKTMIVTTTAAGNGKGPRGPGFYVSSPHVLDGATH